VCEIESHRSWHGVPDCWYRPRIEGLLARIERWCAIESGISHWRCITRDNVTTLYGLDATSCLADPTDPRKIFSYLPAQTFDDIGNIVIYGYFSEDSLIRR
jgi:hypothetical protein